MREPHRQLLDRHVVHHLVVGRAAGRSNRSPRTASCPRTPGPPRTSPRAARRCRHRSSASGKRSANLSSPVPDGIAAVIAHDALVALGLGDQRLGEHRGIARRAAPWPSPAAPVGDVELRPRRDTCPPPPRPARSPGPSASRHAPAPGPRPSLSRTFFSTGSRWSRLWPSIGPDIIEAQLLEQRAARHHAARIFLGAPRQRIASARGKRRAIAAPDAAASDRAATTAAATDRRSSRPPAARSTCRCR